NLSAFEKFSNSDPNDFADKMLKDGVAYLVNECLLAYESMSYRNVVKFGMHEFKSLIELCMSLNCSKEAIIYSIRINLILLYPLIPAISEYLLEKYFNKDITWPIIKLNELSLYTGLEWYKKLSKNIFNKIKKSKLKNIKINIYVGDKKPEWKIKADLIDPKEITLLQECFKKFNISNKKGMSYIMDKFDYKFNELKFLNGMKKLLEIKIGKKVEI
ncbi:Leucyl-tRNA synthetase, partial [Pseudoloma neurophilia]